MPGPAGPTTSTFLPGPASLLGPIGITSSALLLRQTGTTGPTLLPPQRTGPRADGPQGMSTRRHCDCCLPGLSGHRGLGEPEKRLQPLREAKSTPSMPTRGESTDRQVNVDATGVGVGVGVEWSSLTSRPVRDESTEERADAVEAAGRSADGEIGQTGPAWPSGGALRSYSHHQLGGRLFEAELSRELTCPEGLSAAHLPVASTSPMADALVQASSTLSQHRYSDRLADDASLLVYQSDTNTELILQTPGGKASRRRRSGPGSCDGAYTPNSPAFQQQQQHSHNRKEAGHLPTQTRRRGHRASSGGQVRASSSLGSAAGTGSRYSTLSSGQLHLDGQQYQHHHHHHHHNHSQSTGLIKSPISVLASCKGK
ncbi:unnamed protein product [Protopolystoma xenopodis]|uniref:Uncharacterized protein n=1 Tax=Protopolystoma xenopodis TaxID=117903 RepID=A0A448XSK6_9PLAT|nr:unnamed protein product [Protopolystoma xenopodis]